MKMVRLITILFLLVVMVGCAQKSPGPLAGTWRMTGVVPMTITFRNGETEALGIIEKVSYKQEGNDVLVTYLDGIAKGTTIRYTMTSPTTAQNSFGKMQRLQ